MLMDTIKARHSIRKYTDKQISREDLEVILEAGNYAPNAGGEQPHTKPRKQNRIKIIE
ncbi:nitroreductase family protein [Ruminococcus sp.]